MKCPNYIRRHGKAGGADLLVCSKRGVCASAPTKGNIPTCEHAALQQIGPEPYRPHCISRGAELEVLRQTGCKSCQGVAVYACHNDQVEAATCFERRDGYFRGVGDHAQCLICEARREYSPASPARVWSIGLANATNCSLFHWQGRRLLAYRSGWVGSNVRIAELDRDYQIVADHALAIPRRPFNSGGREDPRLFAWRGRLFCMYMGLQMAGRRIAHVNVCLAELAEDLAVVDTWAPEYDRRASWEKNWCFFETPAGDLAAVYDSEDQRVLLFSSDGRRVSRETTAPPARKIFTHGAIRGGASPVRVGDQFYSFFHGVTQGTTGRVYSVGVATFDADPPHALRRCTPDPILLPDPADRPGGSTPYVVFPCGAVREGERWAVSYGYMDQFCRVAEYSAEAIEGALVRVDAPQLYEWTDPRRQLKSRLWIDCDHAEDICNEVIAGDCYQVAAVNFTPRVIVDLGASWGPFTLLARRRWPDAAIIAYEPDAERFRLLRKNCGRLADCRNAAVLGRQWIADLPPEVRETMPPKIAAFIGEENTPATIDAAAAVGVDHLPDQIDLLKLDIECCELGVLRDLAAAGRLAGIRRIVGEWHFEKCREGIRDLLIATHKVKITEGGQWNYFEADRIV